MPSDLFSKTVQSLEEHPESIRIKKLIFALCKQYWENDLTFINRFSLSDLLEDLIELKPSFDELIASLNTVVKSLNRAQVYWPIAQVIIQETANLYPQNNKNEAQSSFIAELRENTDTLKSSKILDPIEQVVPTLFNHPENIRLKKLLFSVYRNRWENEINQIECPEFQDLILKIYQVYPTPQELDIALTRIVETLNKPVLYRSLTQIILNAFEPLHDQTPLNPSPSDPPPLPKQPQICFETQIIPLPSFPSPGRNPLPSAVPLSHKSALSEDSKNQEKDFLPQVNREKTGISVDTTQSIPKTYDLFELRQRIMQYTNPLWAKILLFSVLIEPWDINNPDWISLRSQTLDKLIEQLVLGRIWRPELEIKLRSMAIALSEKDDPLQAANTLIETLKPFVAQPRQTE